MKNQNNEDTINADDTLKLSNYINELINKMVYVKLNDDSEFNGKLISFDSSFNLVLENCSQIKSINVTLDKMNIIKLKILKKLSLEEIMYHTYHCNNSNNDIYIVNNY